MTTNDKIYIIGASGNIGERVVKQLLAKGVQTTIYVRDVEKSKALFENNNSTLTTVQGDYSDFTNFEKSIQGHTRLFLLVADLQQMPAIKEKVAKIAYEAGVKQIVDLSSRFSQFPWRTSFIGEAHRLSEERIYRLALQYNATTVALRPSRFFTNHLFADLPNIKMEKTIYSSQPPDEKLEWISTDDIADIAVVVLTDPIEKHGNLAYPIIGDAVDGQTRAKIVSKVTGQPIQYKQVSHQQAYQTLIKNQVPSPIALDIATVITDLPPSEVSKIVLGREFETLAEWFEKNKDKFI
ncbi:hypothetical protein BJ944DRAFT_274606 [Cunninghamella echinulata]|nr:hypothetical protein BJ944DRAFT_274606 [Cunninghamella echinulata]